MTYPPPPPGARRVTISLALNWDGSIEVRSMGTAAELAKVAERLQEYARYLAEREAMEKEILP
jgi:hypothetical protein